MLIIFPSGGATYPAFRWNQVAPAAKTMHRSFHQLGILVASIVMAIGLTLIAGAAIFRLDIVETIGSRELAFALGGALVVLGIFSIASYCVVRAIEWANRR